MPTFTVMIWNVETMGNYPPAIATEQRRAVSFFIAELMRAGVARANGVDVLVIQELRENGCNMISLGCDHLNVPAPNTYSFDLIPAGIPSGTSLSASSTSKGIGLRSSMAWISSISNLEGYGCIARAALMQQRPRTAMPLSALGRMNLCLTGFQGKLSEASRALPYVMSVDAAPAAIVPFPVSNTQTVAQVNGQTAIRFRERRNEGKKKKRDRNTCGRCCTGRDRTTALQSGYKL